MTPRRNACIVVLGIVAGWPRRCARAHGIRARTSRSISIPPRSPQGKVPPAKRFRLGGMVKKGSVERAPGALQVRFVVTDFATRCR